MPAAGERVRRTHRLGRKEGAGRFSEPTEPYPVVVATSRLLSTGVDVPTCKNIVLARPVHSMVEFKQIIGRGTRLLEPDKNWFTIVDYAGATKHCYDEEWDGDPQFVDLDTLLPAEPSTEQPAESTAPAGTETTPPPTPAVAPGSQPPVVRQPSTTPPASGLEGDLTPLSPAAIQPPVATRPETPQTIAPLVPAGAAVPASGGPSPQATPVVSSEPPPSAPRPTGDGITPGVGAVTPVSIPPSALVPGPSLSGADTPATVPMPGAERHTRRRDGRRIAVVGEIVYELGPDGLTLREIPYVEYAREAIGGDCPTLEALRERWLNPDLRRDLQGRLEDDGIDLPELAAVFNLGECDPLDVLAHALFRTPVPSRQDRVARLHERHADWLESFPAEGRNPGRDPAKVQGRRGPRRNRHGLAAGAAAVRTWNFHGAGPAVRGRGRPAVRAGRVAPPTLRAVRKGPT